MQLDLITKYEKTNLIFNLINQQPDIDKISLQSQDPYQIKYQFLINKQERAGLENFNYSKAFIK